MYCVGSCAGVVSDNSTADVAVDQYHRYKVTTESLEDCTQDFCRYLQYLYLVHNSEFGKRENTSTEIATSV